MNWPRRALCDVASVGPPQPNVPIGDHSEVTFLPMAAVEELNNRHSDGETRKWADVRSGFSRFQNGDVLFSKITPCMENGKITVARRLKNGVGAGSTEFLVIRPGPDLLAEFLAHYLLQEDVRRAAKSVMAGAVGQQRVPRSFVEQLKIPTPPIASQHRVVAALETQISRLEAAQAATLRISVNISRARASVLKAGVEGHLVPLEADVARKQRRPYEHANVLLERIQRQRRLRWADAGANGQYKEAAPPNAAALPPIPDGWVWTTLEAIAAIQGGLAKGKKRAGKDLVRSVPYLRVANVQRGSLDLAEVKHIEATASEIAQLRLMPGDILFNEGGDRDKLGRGWVWEGQIPECIHQNHVFRARIFTGDVLPKFLSWYANTNGQRYFFDEGKHTTNLASISKAKLSALPVPLPPLEEQRRIVAELEDRLSVLAKCEETVSRVSMRSAGLRQAVLKAAFNGTLVPDSIPTSEHKHMQGAAS